MELTATKVLVCVFVIGYLWLDRYLSKFDNIKLCKRRRKKRLKSKVSNLMFTHKGVTLRMKVKVIK